MRVLIVGSGGREHALAWGCAQHPSTPEIICAPGNAGTAQVGVNVNVSATDGPSLADLARQRDADLVVIGPDASLAAGVADRCRESGVAVFGASAAAAKVEWSKRHAKELMDRAGVPTARWRSGDRDHQSELVDFVLEQGGMCVVKADGLAAGKGVTVCDTPEEALKALAECLDERRFGAAGDVALVEERLAGPELSVFALCDGRRFHMLATARAYKRAHDRDRGPNTGGMGAYAPVDEDPALLEQIATGIIRPTVAALGEAGTPFVGCLYAGLMLTSAGPRVLEFNARFGDPETQAVVPLCGDTFFDLLLAAAHGDLSGAPPGVARGAAVVVVAAAQGYPGSPRLGNAISGLESLDDDVICFHGGTSRVESGSLVTAGGRVLGIVGRGPDVSTARRRAYDNVARVHFDGMWSRSDIGAIPVGTPR